MRNEEDIKLLTRLRLSIQRALWGELIPSLRRVVLKWNPGNETAGIYFYHDGPPITDAIEEHYSCIHTEVRADFIVDPEIDFKVIRFDYPSLLPKEQYVIYARKERFEDPKGIE